MSDSDEIRKLSIEIWKNCANRPTRIETEPFDERLSKVDIREFIIHNFFDHHGTALRELMLATSKFWNDLTFRDWTEIFNRLRGNRLAEYYMTVIANQYLGIDPEFSSTRDVEIMQVTTQDGRMQSGKPALFVDNMEGLLREYEEEYLHEDFGLSIRYFVAISQRLNEEKPKTDKPKNWWMKLLGK